MEKDSLNYSPTVMFRGTPCILQTMQVGQGASGDRVICTFLCILLQTLQGVEIFYYFW